MRHLISLLGLAAIVGSGYFAVAQYMNVAHGQSSSTLLTPDQSSTSISADSAVVLALLSRLQAINLEGDSKVLSNETFQTLQDWTVEVPLQEVGRLNPFLQTFGITPVPASTTTKVALPRSNR